MVFLILSLVCISLMHVASISGIVLDRLFFYHLYMIECRVSKYVQMLISSEKIICKVLELV